ncbi:transmembrane protein 52-like [Acipenser ruthenus]|uniref:transmembrane protein 52-like n=1 Tax=Acipenser ruthenus TaxID=7906 RepID=UPI0015617545|nr:transmembrane protein 52-like [Acipenser ruthenus]
MNSIVNCNLVLTSVFLQVSFTTGDEECEEHNTCQSQGVKWTNLWYVWLILLAILVLLLCGVIVSCVKFCCRKEKPPVQTLTELPCEISVVAMDDQSTVHSRSTVASFNSVQLPPDRYVPFPFGQVNKGFAPPPYNLYALEMPPPYDEALKMSIDPHENSPGNRKADNRPSQGHAGDSHLQPPPPSSEEELNVLNAQRRPQEHFDEVQLDDPPRYELHDISSPISEEDENDLNREH